MILIKLKKQNQNIFKIEGGDLFGKMTVFGGHLGFPWQPDDQHFQNLIFQTRFCHI